MRGPSSKVQGVKLLLTVSFCVDLLGISSTYICNLWMAMSPLCSTLKCNSIYLTEWQKYICTYIHSSLTMNSNDLGDPLDNSYSAN